MGKYGTNLTGFGAFEGGVNSDKGASIISTSSDGETAHIFGSAALRTIQAGVENGDFAIPPDAAGDTITEENSLPYWTFTDTDSAGAITCAIVADSTTGSGNKLRWTVAAGTTTGKTATLSRYVAIPATSDRSYSSYLEVAAKYGGSATSRNLILKLQFYTSALVATGTAVTRTYAFSSFSTSAVRTAVFLRADGDENLIAPADAAYAKIELAVDTTGTNASESTLDVFEVKLLTGVPMLMVVPRTGSDAPASIWKDGQLLTISAEVPSTWTNGTLSTTQAYLGVTSTAIVLGNYPATAESDFTVNGTITGAGVTTDLKHGITLQRTTNLTVNTSVDASATAITWSSAVKNTSLYAYWSSGSTISIPLTGWYSITCHLISGTGLGTGFAFRLYALVNGTVIAESETQAGANTTSDTFSISTIAYMTAADSLVFRASASAASKTIGGSRRSACSVVYLGNTSA